MPAISGTQRRPLLNRRNEGRRIHLVEDATHDHIPQSRSPALRRDDASDDQTSRISMNLTLFDKIWARHIAGTFSDRRALITIDRHVVDETTSWHAFDALWDRGLTVRHPELTWSMIDHSVATKTGRTADSYPPTCDIPRRNCDRDAENLRKLLLNFHEAKLVRNYRFRVVVGKEVESAVGSLRANCPEPKMNSPVSPFSRRAISYVRWISISPD
jgi:hypothetical protein